MRQFHAPHPYESAACSCHPAPHLARLANLQRTVLGPRERRSRQRPVPGTPAQQVIRGRFVTLDPERPTADAVAVSDGRIVGIGSRSEVDGLVGPSTRLLDLDGVALPGFIEPHMHYWVSALLYDWVDCSPLGDRSLDEILASLAASGPTMGEWTLGRGFDPSLVDGRVELDREILDQICGDRPVLVMNASVHFAYVNSRALEMAGIRDDDPDPDGGAYGRDASGRVNGVLGEIGAMAKALALVPQLSEGEVVDRIVKVSRHAASNGVTRTHDAGTGALFGTREPGLFELAKSRLACRVSYSILDQAADSMVGDGGLLPFAGDDLVRATHWKIISDGSNQGYSGYQVDEYLGRETRGEPNHTPDALAERMGAALDAGWPLMVHANGDAAIAETIDCFRRVAERSPDDLRHRIEHCSFATSENLADMRELGLSPSFLMNHVHYWGQVFRTEIVGESKANRLDPVASALAAGLRPSVHSDYTVTDMRPLLAVQTAITRRERDSGHVLNPAECVSVDDAMALVTTHAAWQVHSDSDLGTLEVGKFADMTILGDDPFGIDPEGIGEIDVLGTLVAGEERL